LELEERLKSEKREAASRRIEELQSVVGSHARVSIAIGPTKDMLVEQARRLQAHVLVGRSPQSGMLGRLRDLSYAVVRRSLSGPKCLIGAYRSISTRSKCLN